MFSLKGAGIGNLLNSSKRMGKLYFPEPSFFVIRDVFEISFPLKSGTYEFIYLVDDKFLYDIDEKHKDNGYGGCNNVREILEE